MQAEQITDSITYHGEGPVWFPREGVLHWVDMLAGDVLTLKNSGNVTRKHVGDIVATVRPRRDGGAVIGVERGFALMDSVGEVTTLPEIWSSEKIRMNEGGCDPDGRFYCGSMAYDQTPGAAKVFRLSPDGSVDIVLEGVTVSNGLEWGPDGTLAYYNDTATFSVSVFDYSLENGLHNRRTLTTIADSGRPDGLTVDAEGGIWTAIANQSAVHRYSPEGKLDQVINLPATKVTACTFGGANLDELYITTSREDLPEGEEPRAGALFRVEPGVKGMPTREFAG